MKLKNQIIFLDSTAFFIGIENNQYSRFLSHLENNDHKLVTSITVLGELVQQCFQHDINNLYKIVDLINNLNIQFIYPPKHPQNKNHSPLRKCCLCLDDVVDTIGIYGSSLTDRTHLAYAISFGCDFFLTSGREPSAMKLMDNCPKKVEVCNDTMLKTTLGY